ncbi:MAG: EscS/YscS/HrcS family type III secretion system export apparatus protein [Bdellovibrionota bacterium]|jgi:type III secretion protein S
MFLDGFIKESFLIIIICSLVPLLICCISGLLVAILQALTQIQEQSISYVVKFLTLSLILWLGSEIFSGILLRFIEESLQGLAFLGKMS